MTLHKEQLRRGPPEPPDPLPRPGRAPHLAVGGRFGRTPSVRNHHSTDRGRRSNTERPWGGGMGMAVAKRKLGRTGLQVTTLGYGAMELRGAPRARDITEGQAEAILNKVLDAGINYIDTSIHYGLSEERIGRYISPRRAEYYLASKCGCLGLFYFNHIGSSGKLHNKAPWQLRRSRDRRNPGDGHR